MNPDLTHSLNSLRILSIDMISYAKSGHPGICLGAAPIIYSLYANHLRINPQNPNWINRDRFVLSAGHGSALLYATLFMAGYDVSIDDLVEFRKLGSKTPGHPELGKTPGVDVSTGPLGQGFATAVGMAMAERYLSAQLHEKVPKQKLIDYYVYCLVSDGDIMEGIFNEAASIAGTMGLSNLIVLYDSNGTTVDGALSDTHTEDTIKKLLTMGWEVDYVPEGNDVREIDKAIERAKYNKKPTLIEVKTVIGRGSQHEGKSIIHGKPLTKEDIANLRKTLNIHTNTLEITENAVNYMRKSISHRLNDYYKEWNTIYQEMKNMATTDEDVAKIMTFLETKEDGLTFNCNNFKIQNDYLEELRESNSKMMNIISERSEYFLGGSADLATSCNTNLYKEVTMSKRVPLGRNIAFGLREHAMGAILNGFSLSGFRTFGSTFLAFADYLKPSIRMSALMNLPVTYIFTHDSVYIGEDGPTHQPIEQLTMLRSTPNLVVLRPADINEVIGCWDYIISSKRPTALVLSRSEAHILAGTSGAGVKNGAYIVKKETARIDAVIVSTGIDFTTAYLVSEELRKAGYDIRLISMPSMELFLEQPQEVQDALIPPTAKVFTIEAGSTLGWYRIASRGCAIGIDTFGTSGQKDQVLNKLGFDFNSILQKIQSKLRQ
ncbi:MAG: transketolase [Candidatus Coprovivens sp.]